MRISDWSSDVCSSDLGRRSLKERIVNSMDPVAQGRAEMLLTIFRLQKRPPGRLCRAVNTVCLIITAWIVTGCYSRMQAKDRRIRKRYGYIVTDSVRDRKSTLLNFSH